MKWMEYSYVAVEAPFEFEPQVRRVMEYLGVREERLASMEEIGGISRELDGLRGTTGSWMADAECAEGLFDLLCELFEPMRVSCEHNCWTEAGVSSNLQVIEYDPFEELIIREGRECGASYTEMGTYRKVSGISIGGWLDAGLVRELLAGAEEAEDDEITELIFERLGWFLEERRIA